MSDLRSALEGAAREVGEAFGMRAPRIEGKLLRPQVAAAFAGGRRAAEADGAGLAVHPGFVQGVLAIQMVHEASLLHDDILDGCAERRGKPSLAVEAGAARALVEGDHLLTASYRVACATGAPGFVARFARAVERTVAGEKAQGRARGRILSEGEYREIVSLKSGELFGCAASLGASLRGDEAEAEACYQLGVRIGRMYQMIDDLLDLCPAARLGKPPLLDYDQEKWTWVLAEAGVDGFGLERDELHRTLFQPGGCSEGPGSPSPVRMALRRLELEASSLRKATNDAVATILEGWLERVRDTIAREEEALGTGEPRGERVPGSRAAAGRVRSEVVDLASALGGPGEWLPYFARHSRSFRFSARFFPRDEGRLVAGVYAFCRFTDDLVDEAGDRPIDELRARLATWDAHVVEAYERALSGGSPESAASDGGGAPNVPSRIALLDEVMGETARRGVPLIYARELIRGVGMDLRDPDAPLLEVPDMDSLRLYSYRVASVVGLWLTELFGKQEPAVLRRAEAMGQAMQLTNILRDVGEDLRRGRLYLPRDRMEAHGVSRGELEELAFTGSRQGRRRPGPPLPAGYIGLLEELIAHADSEYERAMEGVPALPTFFQRPVAVAGRVYRGIHREIRRNGHDNLTRRAHTSFSRKVILGSRGLWEMREARKAV